LIESVERAKKGRQEAEEGLAEKTEVLQGAENILNFVLPRYAAIKENMDTCHDYHGPSAVTAAEPIWLELLKLEKSGIKIRFLTDITKENIIACKKFLTLKTSELRHLAGVKGNYAIADRKEYFENTISKGNEQPAHVQVFHARASAKNNVPNFILIKDSITGEGISLASQLHNSTTPSCLVGLNPTKLL